MLEYLAAALLNKYCEFFPASFVLECFFVDHSVLRYILRKAGVHVWVKDIQRLANLTNRSFPESAAEEIHFWSSIGEALEMTNTELR